MQQQVEWVVSNRRCCLLLKSKLDNLQYATALDLTSCEMRYFVSSFDRHCEIVSLIEFQISSETKGNIVSKYRFATTLYREIVQYEKEVHTADEN